MYVCFPFFYRFCDQRQHPRSDKLKLSPQGDTVATEQASQKTKKESEERTKKTVFHEDTREEKQTIQTKQTQTSKKKGGKTERRILITTKRSDSAAFGLWLLC